MFRRFAGLVLMSAGAILFSVGVLASPAAAATTIEAAVPASPGCNHAEEWQFHLGLVDSDNGGVIGRPAPASIEVDLDNGSTVTVPLQGEPEWGVAIYALSSGSSRPTGEATAEVDFAWQATDDFSSSPGRARRPQPALRRKTRPW